ncbi:MAG: SDR family oxidoreductase, partial [Terriglobus roseus]|nr:SDR family oxidoreductase [Terriglobus roseus]
MTRQEPIPNHGRTRGSIVTVSSLAGLNASSGMSAYCASKHALVGLAKCDALDHGPRGVRVNVICPGMIDTDLFRATSPVDAPERLAAITPVRRLGTPEDVAALAAFLCS